jgi:hypothetical protein
MLLLTFMVFRTRFFRDVVSCNLNLIRNSIQAAKSYFAREVPRLDSRREYVISISEGFAIAAKCGIEEATSWLSSCGLQAPELLEWFGGHEAEHRRHVHGGC